jgi:hypothetical protein
VFMLMGLTLLILWGIGLRYAGDGSSQTIGLFMCGLPGLLLVALNSIILYTYQKVGRPAAYLSKEAVPIGESVTFTYSRQIKRGAKVRQLKVRFVFLERGLYFDSKDRRRYKNHAETIASFVHEAPEAGETLTICHELTIPPDAMHTVKAGTEEVLVWQIFVDLDIAYLPDFSDVYELVVLPEIARNGEETK